MQYRSFSGLSSSVPVLQLGMSKDEESKTSEVLLGPVLTGSVRKDLIVPHTEISGLLRLTWTAVPNIPSICWPLVAECTMDYSSFLQKLRGHFSFGMKIIGNYSKQVLSLPVVETADAAIILWVPPPPAVERSNWLQSLPFHGNWVY